MSANQQHAEGKSHKEKMLAGELYCAADPELMADTQKISEWMHRYNASIALTPEQRLPMLREALGSVEAGANIRPPFFCDFGYNIHIGAGVFMNFNCVVLDGAKVTIGAGTQIGPGVCIAPADHPREPGLRRQMLEFARPISIGENVWIGAGAMVLPGVRIQDNSIIGAGAVVTRDVPAGATAVGNPARVLVE